MDNFSYTDEQLIAKFQAGDENAYIELVNRYRNRLMTFVFRYVGEAEQAEEKIDHRDGDNRSGGIGWGWLFVAEDNGGKAKGD